MTFKDIKDVLTFAAFRPEPDDGSAPWIRRFPKKKTLLLNIGKHRTSWRALGKGGHLLDGGNQKGDFKEIASSFASEWRKLTDDGWCNVSLNSRYVISLEANLPRKEGIEDIVRTNPRAALGAKFERNKRYALTSNPEHGTSILLSCEDEVIKTIEKILVENDLRVGRICCGTYTMLRRTIEHINDGNQANTSPPKCLYVICCEGSVCLLTQIGDAWSELRSRSDVYDQDLSPLFEMINPRHYTEELQIEELLFVADQTGSDLPAKLTEQMKDMKLKDLTQSDHLWTVLADLR